MKKLLMMAAVGAMAFCAQAGISTQDYTYELSLVTIPIDGVVGKVQNVTCYLCDKGSTGGFLYQGKTVMAVLHLDSVTKNGDTGVTFYYTPTVYNMDGVGTTLGKTSENGTINSKGNVDIATFTTGKTITWKDMGDTSYEKEQPEYEASLTSYLANNLEAILTAEVKDESGNWVFQEFAPLEVTANGGLVSLGSKTSYSAIPEPTSGVLVFLGLAGLMLKRKRAA